jgi:hypothetical protein
MNTSSRNTIDIAGSVNAANDHRGETANLAAVGLWQKAIDAKNQNPGTPGLAMPMPQKGPIGAPGAAPDALQQSQFLSRFGGASGMREEVNQQAGIFAQVGATSEQSSDALEALTGDVVPQGFVSRDGGDEAIASSGMDFDELEEIDAVEEVDSVDLNDQAKASDSPSSASAATEVVSTAASETRDAKKFASLIERFADRFLMELDAGAAKQMNVDLGRGLIPDASLVLQQSGGGWTLRAQTRSSEAEEKLKLAESSLKERFRARGLGDITLDIDTDERESANAGAEFA